jgi:flagellar basal body-associated protein FliL
MSKRAFLISLMVVLVVFAVLVTAGVYCSVNGSYPTQVYASPSPESGGSRSSESKYEEQLDKVYFQFKELEKTSIAASGG